MMRNTCKDTLYEKVFAGFCEEKDIPSDDKEIFIMLGGLNILEIEIGPFADFNISHRDTVFKVSGVVPAAAVHFFL